MKIEHLAMYVENLEAVKDFFVKYFNAVAYNGYFNEKKKFRSYFLSFDEGARLEIMNTPDIVDIDKRIQQLGYIHLAFSVGCKEKVDELAEKLRVDGYEVISKPRTTGDGYYESCVVGIEKNLIEITI